MNPSYREDKQVESYECAHKTTPIQHEYKL